MPDPVYAIGDIHGQYEELQRVLGLIAADGGPDAKIVFLGDYVDRGPDSRAVVQALIEGVEAGRNWHPIKGNHDRYFTRFMTDQTIYDPATSPDLFWFNPRLVGPIHTAARAVVPQHHLDFLRHLPLVHQEADLLFVHAGLRPGIPLSRQAEDDLVWIRQGFLDYAEPFDWLVVHGHTALDYPEHAGNRVNLDGGAGYFRPLHAAVFEAGSCWLLSESGRIALTP